MHRHDGHPAPPGEDPPRPVVAITCDVAETGVRVRRAYLDAVIRAGGIPVLVAPPEHADHDALALHARDLARRFDAFVLTGGDDPATEPFGTPTHPMAQRIHPDRQTFETELLDALARLAPDTPVLGVCLGMQLMALSAGGALDQHLPDTTPSFADHEDNRLHPVMPDARSPENGHPPLRGIVVSKHHQAIADPGDMHVSARAHDGVIEGIHDHDRRFFLGVQWHPERVRGGVVGPGVFDALVRACTA